MTKSERILHWKKKLSDGVNYDTPVSLEGVVCNQKIIMGVLFMLMEKVFEEES